MNGEQQSTCWMLKKRCVFVLDLALVQIPFSARKNNRLSIIKQLMMVTNPSVLYFEVCLKYYIVNYNTICQIKHVQVFNHKAWRSNGSTSYSCKMHRRRDMRQTEQKRLSERRKWSEERNFSWKKKKVALYNQSLSIFKCFYLKIQNKQPPQWTSFLCHLPSLSEGSCWLTADRSDPILNDHCFQLSFVTKYWKWQLWIWSWQ